MYVIWERNGMFIYMNILRTTLPDLWYLPMHYEIAFCFPSWFYYLSRYLRSTFGWFFIRNYTYEQKTIEIDERENIILQKKNHKNQSIFLTEIIIENVENYLKYIE